MSFFVVIDSCGELTPDMKESGCFVTAPLTLDVGGKIMIDDDTFNQKVFLHEVAACPEAPKSACPSPGVYAELFEETDADHIFAVTLSGQLSGSYNAAQVGANMCLEDNPDKKIYVFNSRSASIGETLIGLKIWECEKDGMAFEEIIDTVEKYIDSQTTWFVLENLDTLRKNGRLSNVKALLAGALKIKPVMSSTPDGNIQQLAQCRGMNKALVKMVENIAETEEFPERKVLAISHCNCPDRAQIVKEALLERLNFKDVIVLDTRGVSSMYANDGGIIVVA